MKRAATIFLILLIPPTVLGLAIAVPQRYQQYRVDVCRAELSRVADRYNVEIVTDDSPFPAATERGVLHGHRSSAESIVNFSPEFVREFGLYPVSAIKRMKLRRVVLCEGLSCAGSPLGGFAWCDHATIYIDVGAIGSGWEFSSKTVHHEMFHYIDYRRNGRTDMDERWERLNRPEFRYGDGGLSAVGRADSLVLTDQYPGFLNHYSTTAVGEDKAEVFANLVVCHAYVEKAMCSDRILNAKVERVRELVAELCPEMNDRFWEKAWATER